MIGSAKMGQAEEGMLELVVLGSADKCQGMGKVLREKVGLLKPSQITG